MFFSIKSRIPFSLKNVDFNKFQSKCGNLQTDFIVQGKKGIYNVASVDCTNLKWI
jgi:hypothetical protein